MGKIIKQMLRNDFIISIATKFFVVLIGIVNSIIINRFLGVELRGEYAYYLSIINILILVLNLGIYQSYPFQSRNSDEKVIMEYVTIFVLQFTAYTLISIIISLIMKDILLTIVAAYIPISTLRLQLTFLGLIESPKTKNVLQVINVLFYMFFLIVAYFFFDSSITFIFVLLILKELIMIFALIFKFKLKLKFTPMTLTYFVKGVRFGFFPMISSILITMNYKVDVIVMQRMLDYKEIGLYAVGVSLAEKAWLIPDAFKEVLFSKTVRKDNIELINLSLKINIFVYMIIVIVLSVFSHKLISLLYGQQYNGAGTVSIIIILGMLPMLVFKMLIGLFNVNGYQKFVTMALMITVLLNMGCNYLLIPYLGVEGAAIASVISYSFCGLVFVYKYTASFNVRLKEILVFSKSDLQLVLKSFYRK